MVEKHRRTSGNSEETCWRFTCDNAESWDKNQAERFVH